MRCGLLVLACLLWAATAHAQNCVQINGSTSCAGNWTIQGALTVGGAIASPTLTSPIPVNASLAATQTLLPTQCGQIFLMDRAAGVVYTLPVPVVGCTFDFVWTVAWASNADEIQTAPTTSTTVFLQGTPLVIGTTTMGFACSPTATVAIKAVGTTTGGAIGGHLHLTAIAATLWDVQGTLMGSGTVATPCAASN